MVSHSGHTSHNVHRSFHPEIIMWDIFILRRKANWLEMTISQKNLPLIKMSLFFRRNLLYWQLIPSKESRILGASSSTADPFSRSQQEVIKCVSFIKMLAKLLKCVNYPKFILEMMIRWVTPINTEKQSCYCNAFQVLGKCFYEEVIHMVHFL